MSFFSYPTHHFSSEQFINALDPPLPREAGEVCGLVELIEVHLFAGPVQCVHVIHYVVYHIRVGEQVVKQAQPEWLTCQCQFICAAVFMLFPVVCYSVY